MNQKQLSDWRQDGFLAVAGLLNADETIELRRWIEEVAAWPATKEGWLHHYEQTQSGVRLARSEYLLAFHDGLRKLLTTGIIPETAAQLLGEPVVLYKEKVNYKYPGGGGYAPHQDAPAYSFVKRHITCSIAVDPATLENGCLHFASGQHHNGLLPTKDNGCLPTDVANEFIWQAVPMQPGDALFFSSYAPHKSPTNSTDQPRRSLYLTYNAASEGDLREAYYQDKRRKLASSLPNEDGSNRISTIGHFEGKPVQS